MVLSGSGEAVKGQSLGMVNCLFVMPTTYHLPLIICPPRALRPPGPACYPFVTCSLLRTESSDQLAPFHSSTSTTTSTTHSTAAATGSPTATAPATATATRKHNHWQLTVTAITVSDFLLPTFLLVSLHPFIHSLTHWHSIFPFCLYLYTVIYNLIILVA